MQKNEEMQRTKEIMRLKAKIKSQDVCFGQSRMVQLAPKTKWESYSLLRKASNPTDNCMQNLLDKRPLEALRIEHYIQLNTLWLQLLYTTRKQQTRKVNGCNHVIEQANLTYSLFAFKESHKITYFSGWRKAITQENCDFDDDNISGSKKSNLNSIHHKLRKVISILHVQG